MRARLYVSMHVLYVCVCSCGRVQVEAVQCVRIYVLYIDIEINLARICFLHAVHVRAEVVKPQVFCHSLSGCTDVTHPQAVTTGHSAQPRPDSTPLISRTTSSAHCTTKMRGVLSSETYPEALPFHWRTHTLKDSHKHTYACTRAPQFKLWE